jgi:S-(hydroxymethyl)glutathione dehydrogenase/alcohol dehydrogenase
MRDEKILVGVPPHDRETQIATLPLHFGKVITGSHGGESRDEKDISRYLRLWKTGKLRLESLITERFSLEEINNAIARMRSGVTVGRFFLRMDH